MKRKYSLALALLGVAATSLTACFGKKTGDAEAVVFWSSFGTGYTNTLNPICEKASEITGVEIDHEDHKSYTRILEDFISSFTDRSYPNIAMGYPDHFAKYLSKGILVPLDEYLTSDVINDYYAEYMQENHFYDDGRESAQDKIYALPFNKSTELLGYNGVFVDYCATIDPELASIPKTWDGWRIQGPKYNAIYKDLIMHWETSGGERTSTPGKKVYGKQAVNGKASDFELGGPNSSVPAGKKLLLDLTQVDPDEALLMSWDATDNAFITLVKQWGAEYTTLPTNEKTKKASERQGHVWFNSSTYQPVVIDMLQFFNRLHADRIFGTPADLGGTYSSDGFANGQVMFMICSSGGLSYNTAKWNHRFSVAPIPYKEASKKRVISQGANICMTNQGNYESAYKVIRALTSGELQTKWCLDTGYYPCSKSAYNSAEYQAFLNEAKTLSPEKAFESPTRVAYREGSEINSNYYMKASENWVKFVDPAFDGSSDLRNAVKAVLGKIFENVADVEDRDEYKDLLDQLNSDSKIHGKTFVWED